MASPNQHTSGNDALTFGTDYISYLINGGGTAGAANFVADGPETWASLNDEPTVGQDHTREEHTRRHNSKQSLSSSSNSQVGYPGYGPASERAPRSCMYPDDKNLDVLANPSYVSPYAENSDLRRPVQTSHALSESQKCLRIQNSSTPGSRASRNGGYNTPPMTKPQSQRAIKRRRIEEETGRKPGAVDRPKGITKVENGFLYWRNEKTGHWHSAIPHDSVRASLIREDAEKGKYDVEPEQGNGEYDVTSFNPSQKHWDMTRKDTWKNIRDLEGNQVMFLHKRPEISVDLPEKSFMMHQGLLLLDADDHPVSEWAGSPMPRTLSSNVEGARLEALRRVYPFIMLEDFLARMPRTIRYKLRARPLFGISCLTQRLGRCRDQFELTPWRITERMRNRKEDLHSSKETLPKLPSLIDEDLAEQGIQTSRRKGYLKRKREDSDIDGSRDAEDTADGFEDNNVGSTVRRQYASQNETHVRHPQRSESQMNTPNFQPYSSGISDIDIYQFDPLYSDGTSGIGPGQSTDMSQFDPLDAIQSPGQALDLSYGLNGNFLEAPPAVTDLREVKPQTPTEQLRIKLALFYTELDFRFWHGYNPPATLNRESFAEQLVRIQAEHRTLWVISDDPPALASIGPWIGSFDQVPVPNISEAAVLRLLRPRGEEPLQIPVQVVDEVEDNSILPKGDDIRLPEQSPGHKIHDLFDWPLQEAPEPADAIADGQIDEDQDVYGVVDDEGESQADIDLAGSPVKPQTRPSKMLKRRKAKKSNAAKEKEKAMAEKAWQAGARPENPDSLDDFIDFEA